MEHEPIDNDTEVFHNQERSRVYREADESAVLTDTHQHLSSILRELSSSFGREISVLDLGCGTGRYFHCLHNAERLTGVDISFHMLKEAANPVRRAEIRSKHIDLVCGDIFEVPIVSASFDLIYSIGVFLGSSSFGVQMCDQVCDLLRPGGKVFLTVADVTSHGSQGTYTRLQASMNQSKFERFEVSKYSPASMPDDLLFCECIAAKGDHTSLSRSAGATPIGSEGGFGGGDIVWRNVSMVVPDILAVVPPSDAFILVDQDLFRDRIALGTRAMPFLERDGRYWGPPSDDSSAIQELERMRQLGATFIVFTWPAFWWLDHYTGFHRYLRSQFRCVLEGELLVAFDLRT